MSFKSLSECAALDVELARFLCGGKALNLARLKAAGFKTPDAFVITTNTFEREVGNTLKTANHLNDPRELVSQMTFSDAFLSELKEACDSLGTDSFAIRSSATDEDAREHSFAGLLESVIDIDAESCPEAVRRVWASFYARERLMFPIQTPLDGPVPSMAVLLQECIESDFAGVIFTRHPLEGDEAVLINVTRGEGETVVSGKGGESVTIKRVDVMKDVLPESGVLSAVQLRELVLTALRVEEALGEPQDIEFAFSHDVLYLLQTRAIAANADCNAPQNHLFSNVNVGEALSGVCTPMTWSVGMSYAKHGFEHIFHAAGLNVPPSYNFVTTFFGHIYLDISQILSVLGQVPFVGRDRFGKIAGVPHLIDYVCDVDKLSRAKFMTLLPISIFRVLKTQSRVNHLSEHGGDFCAWRDQFFESDLDALSAEELASVYESLYAHFIDCGDDMLAAAVNFLISYFLVSTIINRISEKDASELETYLFSDVHEIKSAAPGLELQKMSAELAKEPALKQAFIGASFKDQGDVASFFEHIRRLNGADQFEAHFSEFLRDYGARANQEAELANPRWREDPTFLFQVIQSHLKAASDADKVTPKTETDSAETIRALNLKMFPGNRFIFNKLLKKAHESSRLREVWRAYVVDVLGAFRYFFQACAKRMTACGLLSQIDDVFFLTLGEVEAWLKDASSLKDARLRVAFRRARHEAFLSAQSLPDTFTRHPNMCDKTDPCTCMTQLRGLPASLGCVRARARVIRDLQKDASSLQHGEVIVARSTDVGWTPLFLLASAILTEQGGPLSHAFVVAREYGIPAVVSVPNLLNSLKTGDLVTIEAAKGIVTIEKNEE